jgi:hypothetical protein
MATEREAMMLAVDALDKIATCGTFYAQLREEARTALAALRQALGTDTDSVHSGLALTEGEPWPSFAALRTAYWRWDRSGSLSGESAFQAGATWMRNHLVATASQHEKPPASGSSTAVSGEEATCRFCSMPSPGCDVASALQCGYFAYYPNGKPAAMQASNGLGAPGGER